jgi:hypothetical protein
MENSSDSMPDKPFERFFLGFGIASFVFYFGFLVATCQEESLFKSLVYPILPALLVGFIVGLLSAIGKKWLQFFIELLTKI